MMIQQVVDDNHNNVSSDNPTFETEPESGGSMAMSKFEQQTMHNNNNNKNNSIIINSDQKPPQQSPPTTATKIGKINEKKQEIYSKIKNYLWIFPLGISILVPLNCFIPYFLNLNLGIFKPILPFVSDTGSVTPGANFFSQFMDTICTMVAITAWLRFKQIKYYCKQIIRIHGGRLEKNDPKNDKIVSKIYFLNNILLAQALGSASGGFIVGNWRMSEFLYFHWIGAFFLFACMAGNMILMTYICWILYRNYKIESKPLTMSIATVLAILCCFLLVFFFTISMLFYFDIEQFSNMEFRFTMSAEHPAYIYWCLTTFFEWIAILMVSPFYLAIYKRMKTFPSWTEIRF